jgi:LmbE family N-acetylglucosaminyl deacetylase
MNILAIGAHFDDIELGCGGALAKHVSNGDKVYVYVATDSGYANQNAVAVRSEKTAMGEAKNAMAILGAEELICGNFKTLQIEFIDPLNISIIKLVEKYQIDRVYTHWAGDIHHDHQAVSKATLHSCRHVPQILMYRSNWYYSSSDFKGNYCIDISEFWEVKKKAIECHVSELERTAYKWMSFFDNEAINCGQRLGVERAESFEIVKFLEHN